MKNVLLILFFLFGPYHFLGGTTMCEIEEIHQADKSTQIKANLKQGKYMMSQGNYTGAKAKFQKVLSLDRNNAEAKRLLSQCEQRLNGANKKTSSSNPTSSSKSSSTNNATTLSVNNTSCSYTSEGGTSTLVVRSNTTWRIGVQPASWVHTTRSGNEINIRVDKNYSTSSRTDYFTINAGNKSERINISQSGGSAPYLTLSTYNVNFSSSGGSQTINVNTNCSWDIAVKTNSWGHLTKYGNTLTLRVDANSSSTQRTDYFTIKAGGVEKRVNITQSGSYSSYNSSPSYSSYGNNYYSSYRTYYDHRNWWQKNFAVGIDGDFDYDCGSYDDNCMSYSVGLTTRWGRWDQLFNGTIGVRYRWINVNYPYVHNSYNYYYYGYDYSYTTTETCKINAWAIPITCRFNVAKWSSASCSFFIGIGAEYGFVSSNSEYKSALESNYISLYPQIGIAGRHLECSMYWKTYLQSPFNSYVQESLNATKMKSFIGMQLGIYF